MHAPNPTGPLKGATLLQGAAENVLLPQDPSLQPSSLPYLHYNCTARLPHSILFREEAVLSSNQGLRGRKRHHQPQPWMAQKDPTFMSPCLTRLGWFAAPLSTLSTTWLSPGSTLLWLRTCCSSSSLPSPSTSSPSMSPSNTKSWGPLWTTSCSTWQWQTSSWSLGASQSPSTQRCMHTSS